MSATSPSSTGTPAPPSGDPRPGGQLKKWLWRGLRFGGTAAAFAYILSIVDPDELGGAFARVSGWAFLAACATTFANLWVGAIRWRMLLAAYGSPRRPSLARLTHVYWVGFFYNNYVPGGVGGDVVRGVVTRQSFGERGTTASMTVVLVERALGLSGLLLLVSGANLLRPLPGTEDVLFLSALGLMAAAAGIGFVALSRRIAPRLPGKLGALAASIPVIERPLPFAGALGVSLGTQGLVALTGWFLLASVTGGAVTLGDAFVVVPLAMAATYIPFSIGGAGFREGAFVYFCATYLGVAEADAVAASLLIWGTQLAVSGLGGLSQLVVPLSPEEETA